MKAVTNAELDSFYGVEKTHTTRKLIAQTITETVRSIDHRALSLPYVKNLPNGGQVIDAYQMLNVVQDYGTDPKPLAALLAVLEKSDCPLVAAYRMALAERYADAWADEVDEFTA